ncbi:hypothetical protein HS088_TW15G00443 [Tripterygium wilfordii]|uniref:Uncharacterized protein n=1 Tax=Tripterygium wilfordii TaxID=458696 RepID=A0A7J7CLK1_TRIWF|nr:hypothetical protein HS088_TW15G00443 [Tripterygium wilfordii]
MSIFGSLRQAICADYFGDELGFALPPLFKMVSRNSEYTTKENNNSSNSNSSMVITAEKKTKHGDGVVAIAPIFDGLHCFETLVLHRN